MALNRKGRIAVFATLGQAIALTWALRLPFIVLAYLALLPWLVAPLFGLYQPFQDMAAQPVPSDPAQAFERVPVLPLVVMGAMILAITILFNVFWFRYLLLGRQGALKLTLAAFNHAFWRTLVRIVAVGLATATLFFVLAVLFVSLGSFVGQVHELLGEVLAVAAMLLAYLLPFAYMVRLSLVFPACAVDERLSFSASWSVTRGSTWRLIGALLLFDVPFLIVGQFLNSLLLFVFLADSIDFADPSTIFAGPGFWIVAAIMAPILWLPYAVSYAIVAVAYRDLARQGNAGQGEGSDRPLPAA